MTKITREEVLKLAQLSKIEILDEEIDIIIKQLQDVLTYAARVKEIVSENEIEFNKNVNIFAQDIPEKCNAEEILSQAPDREDNFFVVPKILE